MPTAETLFGELRLLYLYSIPSQELRLAYLKQKIGNKKYDYFDLEYRTEKIFLSHQTMGRRVSINSNTLIGVLPYVFLSFIYIASNYTN